MSRRTLVTGGAVIALFALALAVRLGQHHAALLYPDGYQYLLMARGISEDLEPTTELGPHGDRFVPIPDAAVKPFFPLLVAGAHGLGLPWLDAARLVTAVAGAVAVVALALLVAGLSGSMPAGIGAGLLLAASPSVGFWSGFSGPDPVAQALVLCAALAFVHRRPTAGGILTGFAIATRPEVALVAAAAAIVALRRGDTRRDLVRAAPGALLSLSAVFLVLRTPLGLQDRRLLLLGLLALGAVAAGAFLPPRVLRYLAVAAGGLVVAALLTQSGPGELWRNDWPLLVLGGLGALLLLRDERRSAVPAVVLAVVLLLGAVYVLKNPTLARYFSLLLPAAAVLAGAAVASLPAPARPAAFAAMVAAAALGFLHPVPGSRDYDVFSIVAERVGPRLESRALVTAAPDAYGFWLPEHTVRAMRPGARGAVLLDAAQRLYEPQLGAEGVVVARVTEEIAFARPNGDIDAASAVLVAGRVVSRPR